MERRRKKYSAGASLKKGKGTPLQNFLKKQALSRWRGPVFLVIYSLRS
jgi:hypothetical protein